MVNACATHARVSDRAAGTGHSPISCTCHREPIGHSHWPVWTSWEKHVWNVKIQLKNESMYSCSYIHLKLNIWDTHPCLSGCQYAPVWQERKGRSFYQSCLARSGVYHRQTQPSGRAHVDQSPYQHPPGLKYTVIHTNCIKNKNKGQVLLVILMVISSYLHNIWIIFSLLILTYNFQHPFPDFEALKCVVTRDASIRYLVSVSAPILACSAKSDIGHTRQIQIRYCAYTILCYC